MLQKINPNIGAVLMYLMIIIIFDTILDNLG